MNRPAVRLGGHGDTGSAGLHFTAPILQGTARQPPSL